MRPLPSYAPLLAVVAALACDTPADVGLRPSLRPAIDPGGGGNPTCYVQEGDLGTNVQFLGGTGNPCNQSNVSFDGVPRSISLQYDPTFLEGSAPHFSAVYVLNHDQQGDYEASFEGAAIVSAGSATHSVDVVPQPGLAGIRIRSFVGQCPAGITDPQQCWEQAYLAANETHDELHVCIDNTADGTWTDPVVYCAPGIGGEAFRPNANWTYTVTSDPLFLDVANYDFDASTSFGIGPMTFYWENWNAPNTGWPGACSAPWLLQATGLTYSQGASGLMWTVRVRLRLVDSQGGADTLQLQLAGDCP